MPHSFVPCLRPRSNPKKTDMRIAYVCADPGVPVWGSKGCSIHVREVVRALRRCGAQVELFAARWDGEPPPELQDVLTHALPTAPKGEVAVREQAALRANADLHTLLENEGSFDLIYERYSLWSFAAMNYARHADTPSVLEVNAPLLEEQEQHRGLVHRAEAEHVAAQVFEAATAILAVSRGVASYVEGFAAARGKVCIVPNGVDVARFGPQVEPSLPAHPGVFTVGFVGNVRPWHGLPVLIEAFGLLHDRDPRTRLLVVGGGELDQVRSEVEQRGLTDEVHFTGTVESGALPGLLASMSVAVAPYPPLPHFYFSPLKVYEYMAAGLPVVASAIGELPDIIRDGDNGLLCEPGSPQQLTCALERLKNDPTLCRRLGEVARADAIQHHTWDAVARRILEAVRLALPEQDGLKNYRTEGAVEQP